MKIWILAALAAAAFSSVRFGLLKYFTDEFTPLQIGFIGGILGGLMLLPVGLWRLNVSGNPSLAGVSGAIFSGVMNVIGLYIYVKALELEDISIVSPLRRTTPVIVAVLEPLIFGFSYSLKSLAGPALAVVGAYIVVFEAEGYLQPFRDPGRGVLMAISLAFLYAGVVLVERFAIQQIDPLLFTSIVYITLGIGFTFLAGIRGESVNSGVFRRPEIIGLGVITVLGSISIFYALSLTDASKVVTVKQSVIIFNILIGGFFFGEEDILRKIVGSLLIIAGIVIVIL